jgi:hypothetical protein
MPCAIAAPCRPTVPQPRETSTARRAVRLQTTLVPCSVRQPRADGADVFRARVIGTMASRPTLRRTNPLGLIHAAARCTLHCQMDGENTGSPCVARSPPASAMRSVTSGDVAHFGNETAELIMQESYGSGRSRPGLRRRTGDRDDLQNANTQAQATGAKATTRSTEIAALRSFSAFRGDDSKSLIGAAYADPAGCMAPQAYHRQTADGPTPQARSAGRQPSQPKSGNAVAGGSGRLRSAGPKTRGRRRTANVIRFGHLAPPGSHRGKAVAG